MRRVTVIPPENLDDRKARFVFKSDMNTPGQGTNIPTARVFTPSLDDNSIAYVATPPQGLKRLYFDLEVRIPFPRPGNRWGTMSEWRELNRAKDSQP